MSAQVHSLSEYTFSFGGMATDPKAFSADDVVRLEFDPSFSVTRGAGGGACVNQLTPCPGCKVTLKIRQTHPYNTQLSAALNLAQLGPAGIGVAPLFISDGNGTMTFVDPGATIEGHPAYSVGPEEKDCEWVFLTTEAKALIGGH